MASLLGLVGAAWEPGRVRASDPEAAQLADVAIAALTLLEGIWGEDEDCMAVARFWRRIRHHIEVSPVAGLQASLDAARGLRDLAQRFPYLGDDLEEVVVRDRERHRLA